MRQYDGSYAYGNLHYLDLVNQSRRNQIRLAKSAEKRLAALFYDTAKELRNRAAKSGPNSLMARWALDYEKAVRDVIAAMSKGEYDIISGCMKEAAANGQYIQSTLFDEMDSRYGLNLKPTFRKMFSRVQQEAVNEILSGRI